MSIECYLDSCPHHEFNHCGPDIGPFCHLDTCAWDEPTMTAYLAAVNRGAENPNNVLPISTPASFSYLCRLGNLDTLGKHTEKGVEVRITAPNVKTAFTLLLQKWEHITPPNFVSIWRESCSISQDENT